MVMTLVAIPSLADKERTSELPELAFLEFLAEMESIEGSLVAPVDLMPEDGAAENSITEAEQHWLSSWYLMEQELNAASTMNKENQMATEEEQ